MSKDGDDKKKLTIPGLGSGNWIAGRGAANNRSGADDIAAAATANSSTLVFSDFRVTQPRLENDDDGADPSGAAGGGGGKKGGSGFHATDSNSDNYSDAGDNNSQLDSSGAGFDIDGLGGGGGGGGGTGDAVSVDEGDDETTATIDIADREQKRAMAEKVVLAILPLLENR